MEMRIRRLPYKKIILLTGWLGVLFVFTCVSDLSALFNHGLLRFQWTWQPDFSELFRIDAEYYRKIAVTFIFHKIGHFFCFGVLGVLLYQLLRKWPQALIIGILIAAATEILQLYFLRDGRLLDIGIDTLGMLAAWYLYDK